MNELKIEKRSYAWLAALIAACVISPAALVAESVDLEKAFTNPPDSAKPGVWWHWMGSNVSKEGITRDLEEFKKAGVSGATIFGMADVCTPWAGHIENSPNDGLLAFTDPWWKLVRHAAAEGVRLGIDVGLHNCPGYTSTGGPWITPELSMQQIFHSQTVVEGGTAFRGVLPKPAVDPRGDMLFPMINKQTGGLEKPIIKGRKTYWRDIAVLAAPAEGVIAMEQVIDLTSKIAADGMLEWTPPAGKWVIYRFGHTTMGALTQPNQWEIMGLECDKMSEKAVAFHLGHVIGKLKEHLGPLVGTGLRHILLDSYEAGTPSWTPLMPQEFEKRRGYSLTAFLPTFAGRIVGSDGETAKFRGDFGRTIADLYRDVLFVTMARVLEKENLRFVCEPYGGPFITGEVSPHVHSVMTEFWSGDAFSPNGMDGIFNAGEGKRHNILEAEAFTGGPDRSQWAETPAWLKPVGDGAFCAGINRFILHSNPHQPWNDKIRPGMTMGQWGTHFGRTQTWWEPGKAMVAYWQRCQALLQWGSFVANTGDFSVIRPQGKIAVKSIHRRAGQTDVYFVANIERVAGSAWCGFGVADKQPELWDPVTGTMRILDQFEVRDGKTLVPLDFAPAQSCFIVFRKPVTTKTTPAKGNFPNLNPQAELTGEWQVSFDPKWGGPAEPVRFEKREDWTQRAEPGIKYYSGTAVYRKSFDFTGVNAPLQLDLGTVHCIARVKLNGKDLGVIWCAPWSLTLPPDILKAGSNQLEIEVTNVWANRLIGDEQEPADSEWLPGYMGGAFLKRFPDWFVKNEPRPSKGRFCFTTWNYFAKDSPLIASGLLGPVRLMTEDWAAGVKPTLPEDAELFSNEQIVSASDAPLRIVAHTDSTSAAGLEGALLRGNLLAPDQGATVAEESFAHDGGGTNADSLRNGTTRNGSGGTETLDDGKTFRGYAQNNNLTFRLDTTKAPQGYDLKTIATFAGHFGGRASQNYSVSIAHVADPTKFMKLADPALNFDGAASRLRLFARDGGILNNGAGVRAKGVAAVRFEFRDGPVGFNVYREIQVTGQASSP